MPVLNVLSIFNYRLEDKVYYKIKLAKLRSVSRMAITGWI